MRTPYICICVCVRVCVHHIHTHIQMKKITLTNMSRLDKVISPLLAEGSSSGDEGCQLHLRRVNCSKILLGMVYLEALMLEATGGSYMFYTDIQCQEISHSLCIPDTISVSWLLQSFPRYDPLVAVCKEDRGHVSISRHAKLESYQQGLPQE